MKTYTYSLLGKQGAVGNQLWEVAGTVGKSMMDPEKSRVRFPQWSYQPFFDVPGDWFVDHIEDDWIDLAPDYLQNVDYWWRWKKQIRDIFLPTTDVWLDLHGRLDLDELIRSTAVHVRRANNLNLPDHHPVPTVDYFEKAVNIVGGPLAVYSDDMEWCKKQSIFKDAMFIGGPRSDIDLNDLTKYSPIHSDEAAYDLLAMTYSQNHIISNSSFSWWGAFLRNGGDVVYPLNWYGPALKHIDISRMIPDEWVGI